MKTDYFIFWLDNEAYGSVTELLNAQINRIGFLLAGLSVEAGQQIVLRDI